MGSGFQFIDLIFFAVIAVFLVIRLRGVLGRRDGHEGNYNDPFKNREEGARDLEKDPDQDSNQDSGGDPRDNVVPLHDELPQTESAKPASPPWGAAPANAEPLTAGLAEIQQADPSFVPSEFISGAQIAFEMILESFAAGDTAALKPLLAAAVFADFQRAIRDREAAGETLEETLVSMKEAALVEAWLEARVAYVTVKFVSEQISAVRDENGDVVEGDPNKIVEITDFWTCSRSVRSRDPNWTLAETQSLE